ncbi:unnamed protein product [Symbiodinium natans]|uniref:Uncharacterized protein n=1 Tax=Symbiodinium natans TaxID=878477 RepID=A0A812V4W1_9DINO|nr:unnamed protein product [Symbiodinium natans]
MKDGFEPYKLQPGRRRANERMVFALLPALPETPCQHNFAHLRLLDMSRSAPTCWQQPESLDRCFVGGFEAKGNEKDSFFGSATLTECVWSSPESLVPTFASCRII